MSTAFRLHAAVVVSAILAATCLVGGNAQAQGRDEPVMVPVQQVIVVGKRVHEQRFAPLPEKQEAAVQQVIVTGKRPRPEVVALTEEH